MRQFDVYRNPSKTSASYAPLLLVVQSSLTMTETTIIVAPMDFLRLPLIAVVGAMVYAEPFDPIILFGGLVVIAGNALNLWGERRRARG